MAEGTIGEQQIAIYHSWRPEAGFQERDPVCCGCRQGYLKTLSKNSSFKPAGHPSWVATANLMEKTWSGEGMLWDGGGEGI